MKLSEWPLEGSSESALDLLASVNLNLLVPLLALLEERSVTAAADRIGLSQPAMSHALKKIRDLMGDELLVRQNGELVLTPRAVELVGPLKLLLQQTANLVNSENFDPATDTRTITLTMTTSTAYVLGDRLIALLAAKAPNMTLRIKTGIMTAPNIFTDDGLDAVLLTETLPSPYPRERLFDDRWVVIYSKQVPSSKSTREMMETEPHIVFEDPTRKTRAYIALDDIGLKYQTVARCNDYLLIPKLVAGTRAIAFHRFQVMAEMAKEHNLSVRDFPLPIQNIGVDLVWNPWRTNEVYKAWIRELLFEAAEPLQMRYKEHSNK